MKERTKTTIAAVVFTILIVWLVCRSGITRIEPTDRELDLYSDTVNRMSVEDLRAVTGLPTPPASTQRSAGPND